MRAPGNYAPETRMSRQRKGHPQRYRFSAFMESLEPRWVMSGGPLDEPPALVAESGTLSQAGLAEPGATIALPAGEAMPNPVFGSTFRSALNGGVGYWDNPASWSAGRAPTASDKVIIQAGDTVIVRNTAAIADSIGVYAGGKL